jgi:uncharacterized protein (DUF1499 family)
MLKLRGKRPVDLGIKDGRLKRCPDSPNCVSSQADAADRLHYVEPLKFTREPKAAMQRLAKVIQSQPRAEIVTQDERYLHTEFSSRLFGYVDDVECYLVPEEKLIHIRSASRLGHSDFGANRKRVGTLRAAFEKNS